MAEFYVPEIGERVPKRGNAATRFVGRSLMRLFGWRIEGGIPNHAKMVAFGAPHTTGWDFGLAVIAIWALGIRLSWLGADWVLRIPGTRWLGGIPVDRSQRHGLVAQLVQRFETMDSFFLAIAPEGSRKKVVPWKSGFYRIADAAQLPLLPVAIDQRNRILRIGPEFMPSGDFEADMEEKIRPYFAEFLEAYPDNFGM